MPLYVVDALSTFRMRYVVEAKCEEHALDEVTMIDSGSDDDLFYEFSQKHIGHTIVDSREITRADFDKLVQDLKDRKDKNDMGSPWMGDKIIRVVKYKE